MYTFLDEEGNKDEKERQERKSTTYTLGSYKEIVHLFMDGIPFTCVQKTTIHLPCFWVHFHRLVSVPPPLPLFVQSVTGHLDHLAGGNQSLAVPAD